MKLHPENLDIVFNFKLTESYPTTRPVIEIRSEALTEDETFDLHSYLTQASVATPLPDLTSLVTIALDWLNEGRINVTGNCPQKKGKDTHSKKKKTKKNKTKEEVIKGKKPPMKTAIDVVKRILWDPELQQDRFLVGYLDRLEGLKEKYFTAFSWEDIASVDYTVLAIPKHRIQYFKYKEEIVWDKRSRLDNVFGSTGSGQTIRDIVLKLDGVPQGNGNGNGDAADAVGVGAGAGPIVDSHPDSDYYDSGDITDSDSDDDDDDDGISVTIDNGATGFGNGELDREANATEDDQLDKYWRDKLRPNYFIALRITDEGIRDQVREVQNYVISNEDRLTDCCIPAQALHITLCTVGLETDEQVQNCIDCLREAKEELASIFPKNKNLTFRGVQNFFNRVIYGNVVDCPQEFYDLVEHLKLCLNERGIEIRDYHEFVPHMSLMKVSRPVARATGNNYIAPWLYSCFNQTVFGHQSVDNIHLCEMGDERQPDGFYKTAVSLKL